MKRFAIACLGLLALGGAQMAAAQDVGEPVRCLIITGDHRYHDWEATTDALTEILSQGGRIDVDVTTTPGRDLTPENLERYDVLVLNYRESEEPPEGSKWSEENKQAFLDAVEGGTGLAVFHYASSAFPEWDEYETATAGGWRTQGFHGPPHAYTVSKTEIEHPISEDLPAEFDHTVDELYQNSKMVEGNTVLATAYSDPDKPRGTGKDEPVIWVNTYGDGRVYHNALGHDVNAMSDPTFRDWMLRGTWWAATGDVLGMR